MIDLQSYFKDSGKYFYYAANSIIKMPLLLVPLLFTWIFFILIPAINVNYFNSFKIIESCIFIFLFIFSIGISNLFLLEVFRQLETKETFSLFEAIINILKYLLRSLPIIILFTLIWIFLMIILSIAESLFSTGNRNSKDASSYKGVAQRLGGQDTNSTPINLMFNEILRIVRIYYFLLLTSIVWEKKNFFNVFKRVNKSISQQKIEFSKVYSVSLLIYLLMGLFGGVIFYVLNILQIAERNPIWIGVIIILGFFWIFSIFLEQYATAHFYLKYLKWENNNKVGSIDYLLEPDMFDNILELKKINNSGINKYFQ